ncbi:protein abrupt isoform X3 [Eurytemora carolleeae]|uniref:protein abrupt isoform X3 n=1 Tax=Eurytemora carolleeae TaxID=1294199 RepID=UPI000C79356D|nr:protein abrupt isoform X3 [Eurytemora carolleeae]|eukprot:XP_023336128.1 protein abrupt-like isoform X3 [Eurytemora affinis]
METLAIADHKYNLRWPDYHDTILSTFRSLKADEDFVDVTLSCEEHQYSAHKVVLSACSPYFRKLLKNNPCQHPIVILRDVAEDDLRCLLNFMYHGEVQVAQDNIQSFLRTAETLQIKGLSDHPLKDQCQKTSSTSLSPPTCQTNPEQLEQMDAEDYSPRLKRVRHNNGLNGPHSSSPPLPCRQSPSDHSRHNGDREPWQRPISPRSDNVESSSHKFDKYDITDKSLLSQALEKSDSRDSASDTTGSERPGSASLDTIKSEMGRDIEHHPNPLFPPGLEALYRQAGFPSFLGLGQGQSNLSIPTLPGPSTTHVGLQSHAANPTIGGLLSELTAPVSVGGKLEMMRVRATDPRPCPKCGKIYRSAHTLRTHMEDKHTICPGYRCVLCGTVAKSRNSLHSHMSRQHRGISTKDLPVLPMPSPFDPDLASKLLSKAGVKVSASELAARASPTAPRRSDLPKLDNSLSIHQSNQFPLPPSLHPSHLSLGRDRENTDPEDLRVPMSSPYSSSPFSSPNSHPINSFPLMGGLRHPNPKDFPGMGGSALLDTYLSMIAAADGNVAAAAAALNFQNSPARAAAMAAAAAAAGLIPMNGKDDRYGSDREDEGELGSDAENDDISEVGDTRPTSAGIGITTGNNGDH